MPAGLRVRAVSALALRMGGRSTSVLDPDKVLAFIQLRPLQAHPHRSAFARITNANLPSPSLPWMTAKRREQLNE